MPPPTAAHLIESATARLAGSPNPRLDAEMLFRGVSGMDRATVLTRGDEAVDGPLVAKFEVALARRLRGEPIQYILGRAAFWRDEFAVGPSVLIPRPDTEILVEAAAARLRDRDAPALLDIGTGSGCIALSLLRELPGSRAIAVDVSEAALEVARRNARDLGLDSRVEFRRSNWLDAVGPSETFDAIVSNPPYVSRDHESGLPGEVRDHEPALALFADRSDDLSSYRSILSGLGRRLRSSGILALEVGAGQAGRVAQLLKDSGLRSIEVLDDLAAIPRVVLGRR